MSNHPRNGRPANPQEELLDAAGIPRGPVRTPQAHQVCDGLTEAVLYAIVVLGPWLFGTTQAWSIRTMNLACYVLGLLLAAKWVIRWRTGFRPMQWGNSPDPGEPQTGRLSRFLTLVLAVLTVVLLGWCLISAWNARANYQLGKRAFDYFECIRWLPHSYDRDRTWLVFWQYLGYACFFWALRDWLLGKTPDERQAARDAAAEPHRRISNPIPARFRRLLWVLCINGALVALVSILHKISGAEKLLWILKSRTAGPEAHFGPYNYRTNAAQYLNLVWPLCLGFWWVLRHEARVTRFAHSRAGEGAHVLLLPCSVLLAAAPIVSNSRGGAIGSAALAVAAVLIFLIASPRRQMSTKLAVTFTMGIVLVLGFTLGWDKLSKRLYRYTESITLPEKIDTNAFTLRLQFQANKTNATRTLPLASLSDQTEQSWARSGSFRVFLSANGSLSVQLLDGKGGYIQKTVPGVLGQLVGQTGDVFVVRSTNLSVTINGEAFDLKDLPAVPKSRWSDPIGTRRLYIGGFSSGDANLEHPVRRATLFNYALSAPDLASLRENGDRTVPRVSLEDRFASDFSAGLDGFTPGHSAVRLGTVPESQDGGLVHWMKLTRDASAGPLVALRSWSEHSMSPGHRAGVAASFRNPSAAACRVGIGVGSHPSLVTTVPAEGEATLRGDLQLKDSATLLLSVGLVDESGAWATGAPAGSELLVRDVEFVPLGVIAEVKMRDKPVIRLEKQDWSDRDTIYEDALTMAADFPWWGAGPGAYSYVSQLYREETPQYWAGRVHDDYLETRINFGWVGLGLILVAFAVLFLQALARGPGVRLEFRLLSLAAMAMCMAHAKLDFPFLIHSIVILFLVHGALLGTLGRRAG
jgi:O-antigen ligase